MAPTHLADLVDLLDSRFPPSTAQSWDAVGLVCGDLAAPVRTVLLAVDPVEAVVAEAERLGADLLIVHHPLLLRPVHSVAGDTAKGRVVHRLIRNGCALYVAHTNADAAAGGVNDTLAGLLGLVDVRPLEPAETSAELVLVSYVPAEHADAVLDAAARAGAGRIGEYSRCAWTVPGSGTFEAGDRSNPTIGNPGERTEVPEIKLEMVLPPSAAAAVLAAVRAAHPYEEPAMHLLTQHRGPADTGIGRVGRLPAPTTLRDLAHRVAQLLPPTAHGVRASGDPDARVETVAVCGGAGDSMFGAVRRSGADVYLTADLRHHPASEARDSDGTPYLLDVSHWASEWPWLKSCADELMTARPGLTVTVSRICTDPWTFTVPSPEGVHR